MPVMSFQRRGLPLALRAAASLLFLQGAILALAGFFVLLIGVLLGPGNAVPFAGAMLSGGGAIALGVAYAACAAGAVYVSVQLGRLAHWTRTAGVCFEAALIVLYMAQGALSVNMIVNVVLSVVVAALLLTPGVGDALATKPTGSEQNPAARPSNT